VVNSELAMLYNYLYSIQAAILIYSSTLGTHMQPVANPFVVGAFASNAHFF